jgi:hypothetical protein
MSIEPEPKESIQSLGGIARAEKLSKEQRSAIARTAAVARWDKKAEDDPERVVYPKATHAGTLKIGEHIEIECAVLEDGTRVLSRAGFVRAIGRKGKVKGGADYEPESKLPVFLGADNLQPFISNDLISNSNPLYFKPLKGGSVSMGYRAELLPAVCNVFLSAKESGKLRGNQRHIAKQCEILIRGLAVVGVTGLVDEATGYQEVRDRQALQQILEKYISGALLEWTKTFPLEFYKEIFRLKGWEWKAGKMSQLVGRYTNDLVYERLAPGVLEQLRLKNPVTEKGYRQHKHHQWLTRDIGHPSLTHHIYRLLGMMEASNNWMDFKLKVDAKLPKVGANLMLDLTN